RLPAGDYVLTVDGTGDATGDYQLRLLDLASAPPLTPGTPVSGTLEPGNETDLYRFDASAGDHFFFDAQAAPYGDVWRLIDPDGAIVFSRDLSSDVDALTLGLAGTYVLAVEGAAGQSVPANYAFVVQPVTFASQPLTLGDTVSGAIAVPGEQD